MTDGFSRTAGVTGPGRSPQAIAPRPEANRGSGAPGPSFAAVLRKTLGTSDAPPLRFSGHAQDRLQSRGIQLTPGDLAAIDAALGKAQAKGARDTLVLLRDLGFIVSIPNRTVVTALDRTDLRDRVFTQLDSTVIAG